MRPAASRREFMASALSVAVLPGQAKALRVDFHHHFLSPRHIEAILAQRESGAPPKWSPELSLEEMDKNGVPHPGTGVQRVRSENGG